mgnify:CR=1 FL=1
MVALRCAEQPAATLLLPWFCRRMQRLVATTPLATLGKLLLQEALPLAWQTELADAAERLRQQEQCDVQQLQQQEQELEQCSRAGAGTSVTARKGRAAARGGSSKAGRNAGAAAAVAALTEEEAAKAEAACRQAEEELLAEEREAEK